MLCFGLKSFKLLSEIIKFFIIVVTWSLKLREECRLRVFENKVLRRIFGLKRDEVRGEWRRLRNEELYALYSSPNISRVFKSRKQIGNLVKTLSEKRKGILR
jgi:hypothetical protein